MIKEREQWKKEYLEERPKLLAEWKEKGTVYAEGENDHADVFISDGIADPDKWFEQEICPLFILKEAYGGEVVRARSCSRRTTLSR